MTETSTVKVKTERPDEAEIRELAAKMVEANKAKALAASAAAARPPPGAMMGAGPPGAGGQMGILNFLTRKPGANNEQQRPAPDEKKTPAPDEASWKGHFGWDMLGKCHIPYIYRSGEKYVAVRMVEIKLLNKYLNYLHADIYSCTCIRSYYITEIEARLLNEINNRHCDGQFGREPFTQKDLVVRLSDAYEFYNFLDVCYNKLLRGTTNNKDKCGFIRINKESVVPYTVRDNQKFVPLFYFEGETDNLKLKADQLKGWDLSYLKFCCKQRGLHRAWGSGRAPPPAPPPGAGAGAGAGAMAAGAATGALAGAGAGVGGGARGRRPGAARHSAAAAALQLPHAGISAAAVQALANGWSLPGQLTQAQTQQVLRLAQAQVAAQAQAAARYSNAALAAAASLPQHRSQQHQRNVQFPNSAITMAMGQQPPPPLVRSTANTTTMNVPPQVTGTMNGHSTSHSVDTRKRLTPIPDINITGSHTPYKVQKALVENTMVPCINAKPYQYTELLMTLPDLASHFFPRVSLATCRAMLDALGLTLYRPNSTQLQVLRNSGKCKSAAAGENGLALVQIRDVMQRMPQFKYMLRSGLADDEHAHQAHAAHPHQAHAHVQQQPHHAPRPAHAAQPPHAKRARAN
ncbi:unnamed protein product [Parnassius apollo]|uniref:(apollo) hypothetical protein n=1 Tax=Parnassius apollo TaxID=110799 RepID=A0A8S3Y9G5_PARAO|nr:unnamed protein product [Parnassius apollo]